MGYLLLTAGVFLLDFVVKRHMEQRLKCGEPHLKLKGRIILEKYYNKGAALNFLSHSPKKMTAIHTAVMLVVAAGYYFLLRIPGKSLGKTGMALLMGGGLNNLYDRYTKGYVVDYFRIYAGPKRLRRIIFNISDFCIFIGAVLSAAGSELE